MQAKLKRYRVHPNLDFKILTKYQVSNLSPKFTKKDVEYLVKYILLIFKVNVIVKNYIGMFWDIIRYLL